MSPSVRLNEQFPPKETANLMWILVQLRLISELALQEAMYEIYDRRFRNLP
jgi:hypothetical protein